MTRLESLRTEAGLSKSKLARMASMNPSTIIYAEQRGFRPYDGQLERLATALGWQNDPQALLEDVNHADH